LRILHLLSKLSGGGAEQQFGYLAPEFVRRGHRVDVGYLSNGPTRPELPCVRLHHLVSLNNYDPYLLWQLMRLIRRVKPDIVATWILQMDILGGMAARINGLPWIFREPSSAKAYPQTWKNRLRARIGSIASAVVSNSSGGDDYWKTRIQHSRCYIVPNGLPVREIDRTVPALPTGMAKPEAPIVLYVGRLTSDVSGAKNLKVLLRALACVKLKQNVFAVLCGEGPQRSELETLKNKLRLDACVQFTGNLPPATVWALMKKASVFVSLSAYEGCPNSVMEAMACGCPLVLSDIPAHREILDETSTLFVDPINVQVVTAAIAQALGDQDASKGRAFIAKQKSKRWSVEKAARDYEKVYKEVISQHSLLVGKGRKPAFGKGDPL